MSSAGEFEAHGQRDRCSFEPTYSQWCAKFAPFESKCFEAFSGFVRAHFDSLLDRYYWEDHESMRDFPAWAFEATLRKPTGRALGRTRAMTEASAGASLERLMQ